MLVGLLGLRRRNLPHQWLDHAYEQDPSCPTAPAYQYLGIDPELKDEWEVNPWQ